MASGLGGIHIGIRQGEMVGGEFGGDAESVTPGVANEIHGFGCREMLDMDGTPGFTG